MNTKRLRQVADYVEQSSHFDMQVGCDCIAAKTLEVKDEQFFGFGAAKRSAKKFLGLTERQARALFIPRWLHASDKEVYTNNRYNKSLAARVLRRLAKTGKIIWR